MKRAVFLDRDGVINRKAPDGDYITRWEDFCVLQGVVESIAQLNQAGFCVVVITNQRCVSKGLITSSELEKLHQQMSEYLAQAGAKIDAVYYCPHETEPVCRCRKPAPGMLLDAAHSHDIDLAESWMIGDSEVDVAAGKNAGCKAVRLISENTSVDAIVNDRTPVSDADIIAVSLLEAIRQILPSDENVVGSLAATRRSHETFAGTRPHSL